jgi:transposase
MGRMEILTGVERRRDWSDDEKLSILQEAADPDARIADVARRHDIKPQQIYTWRRKFTAEQTEPVVSFLPVALIATPSSDEAERPAPVDKPTTKRSARPIRIEIGCKGGRVLKVEANIEPDVLKALIRSVEDA